MKEKFKWICLIFLSSVNIAISQNSNEEIKWMRYPSISPDGSKIAFGYKGDIYVVNANGGTAIPITIHESQDMMPVWSKDGSKIAFASDRYGNFDVFVIEVNGDNLTRLTYHSAPDFPQDFTSDNSRVLFMSARIISKENIRFYSPRLFNNLYTVNVKGGKAKLISEAGFSSAKFNSDNTKIIFQDRKGYEDLLRKHHTSSVTRDIWSYDIKNNSYQKISNFEGEDLEPVFEPNSSNAYFLSEKSGSLNIVKFENSSIKQITNFSTHPVRHLSVSNNNTLCFTYNGSLYTKKNNQAETKIIVKIQNDGRINTEKNVPITGNVTEFVLAPNGKEIAFVTRGEVFVTSVSGEVTKRITNTPQQERSVQWSPDSKTLLFAAERENSWDIYKASLGRTEETYFSNATIIKEELILGNTEEEFQPKFSPDGKEIAYIAERNALKIYNLKTKGIRTILPLGRNYSYSDGDWDFNWSPDGKYLLVDDSQGNFGTGNVAVIDVNNPLDIKHPYLSGYGQSNAKWLLKGKAISWLSGKKGRKSHAYQGSREQDIYFGFFDQTAFDRFNLSKNDFNLLKEKEDEAKKNEKKLEETKKDSKDKTPQSVEKKVENIALVFENFKERINRITINSSSILDYEINEDASKVYYLTSFDKGFDLWVVEPRTKETKILAKLGTNGSNLELSNDGKFLFVLKNGTLLKIDETGKQEPISINSEMVLNPIAERKYILDHAYRQVQKKFYDPKLHGLDWKMLYENYTQFLPHISNNYDFQELLSEFLGELNASHTGGRFSPVMNNPDQTASLGLLFDENYEGNGLKVSEVILGGPFNIANSKLKPGCLITKIDEFSISSNEDWWKFLNRKVDKNTLVTFIDSNGTSIQEVIKPISLVAENGLMYNRWVKLMKDMVYKLSGGKIGYVHVQGMNDGSYRDVFDEVLGENFDKKALIVDTRFNGGGWLHDDLKTFLSGEKYLEFAPQGNVLNDGEPMGRWYKPSCVLMSEGNYSDAFIFPYVYKQAGIGKTIGMPVPGTGTAVWWETQIDPTMVFGIPMIATIGKEKRPTENLQLEPDIKVDSKYEDFLSGKDAQIEEAVKQMLLKTK